MKIVTARITAVVGVEVEDDDVYEPDEFAGEVRAWISQYGEVKELAITDDQGPVEEARQERRQAPSRPPFQRQPPKIFQQVAAESEPPPPEVARALAALAPSVPVEEPAPEPAPVNEEEPSDAVGRARKRPAARKRRS